MRLDKHLKELKEMTLGHDVASSNLRKAEKTIRDALFTVENQLKLMKGARGVKKDKTMDSVIKKLDSWVRTLKGIIK